MAGSKVKVDLGEPVVVAVSQVNEARWGFHQFPALTRLPDGTILIMYADAADMSETHGEPAPAFVSSDEGRTWQAHSGEPQPIRPHFSISEVFDGEYLVMPSHRYLDITAAGVVMPEPVSEANVYGVVRCYRVEDLPAAVQEYYRHIPARRWSPRTRQWQDDRVEYELRGLMAWKRDGSVVLPRTYFERSLLKFHDELLYADYRAHYALADGTVPPKGASHLMVSADNGRSFQRRATIAADPAGNDLMGEPHLSPTADGNLVCVVRKTDHVQKPMAITWSKDGGRTWTPARKLLEFGVWPCLQLLGCGVLVLSYGRPGVHLRLAADGTGQDWSDPVTLIEGTHEEVTKHTCGYSSLLALSADTVLIAYSDFLHTDADGNRRKAILVRPVSVSA